MKQVQHRGYTIYYNIENDTGFCNAKGRIEFYERDTFCAVNIAGTANHFISREEAESEIISRATKWIDARVKQPA